MKSLVAPPGRFVLPYHILVIYGLPAPSRMYRQPHTQQGLVVGGLWR